VGVREERAPVPMLSVLKAWDQDDVHTSLARW
jgi:hypothetical protein